MNQYLCYFSNFGAHEHTIFPGFPPKNQNYELLLNDLQQEALSFERVLVFGNHNFPSSLFQNVTYVSWRFQETHENRISLPLDHWAFTPDFIAQKLSHNNQMILIDSQTLSRCEDPRPLLVGIKKLLLLQSTSQLYCLFFPMSMDGYRVWDLKAFFNFLEASGFKPEIISETDNNLLIKLAFTQQSYKTYLRKHGIQPGLLEARTLLITTEDATVLPSGGIGTYVKNIKYLLKNRVAVLLYNFHIKKTSTPKNTFLPTDFIDHEFHQNHFDDIGLLESVKCLLFLLPSIRLIEIQDYLSLGYRIVQAKQTGVLPQSIQIHTMLHGAVDHIKYGERNEREDDYTYEECKQSVKDRYIMMHSDGCISPSRYMADLLQNEYDYTLNNLQILKLPFNLSILPSVQHTQTKQIKKIIFIGKYSALKGWNDFIDTMQLLQQSDELDSIRKVIAFGPGQPPKKDIELLRQNRRFQFRYLTHHKLLSYVEKHKHDTLFVLPTKRENYPYIILELALLGAHFISYKSGGIPEVLEKEEFFESCLSDPNPSSLAEKIRQFINSSNFEYYNALAIKRKNYLWERQTKINQLWIDKNSVSDSIVNYPRFSRISEEMSIVVPVYNTPLEYIEELIVSINTSVIPPKEVIWINDGSRREYAQKLEKTVASHLQVPYRIVTQENKGLAGARNKGLHESTTKYTYFIDSDDLLLPITLIYAWMSLTLNPQYTVTSGFIVFFQTFSDTKDWLSLIRKPGFLWIPLGTHLAKAISLYKNEFIPASACVNTALVKGIGGWDDSTKDTWEDYAFYSNLAWSKYPFGLIPYFGYLYRDTPGSMSKTYNRFLGRRRIINNIAHLNKLDSNIIMNLMHQKQIVQVECGFSKNEKRLIKIKRKIFAMFKINSLINLFK